MDDEDLCCCFLFGSNEQPEDSKLNKPTPADPSSAPTSEGMTHRPFSESLGKPPIGTADATENTMISTTGRNENAATVEQTWDIADHYDDYHFDLNVSAQAAVGTTVDVYWTAAMEDQRLSEGDLIVVGSVESNTYEHSTLATHNSQGNKVPLMLPNIAGNYQVRYLAKSGAVLASTPIQVV